MDRGDESPSNTDGGNGVIGEAQNLSGARLGCQLDYDWAFARALFVLMIVRWWWFLSAAAWHALLRAAPLGVDAVDGIVEFEWHSSRYGACLLSYESWCMDGGACLFSSESWRRAPPPKNGILNTLRCLHRCLTSTQCSCCPTGQVNCCVSMFELLYLDVPSEAPRCGVNLLAVRWNEGAWSLRVL